MSGRDDKVELIPVTEVTFSSGLKSISILCDDTSEVRSMVDKFLVSTNGAGGAVGGGGGGGSAAHGKERTLKLVAKTMRRDEFAALQDWEATAS